RLKRENRCRLVSHPGAANSERGLNLPAQSNRKRQCHGSTPQRLTTMFVGQPECQRFGLVLSRLRLEGNWRKSSIFLEKPNASLEPRFLVVDEIIVEDLDRAKRAAEGDALRSALLTSISHDFRTPLSAILGAASTLHSMSQVLNESQKADLLATIIDESERLNRFLTNLLDMTTLKSGTVV